MTKIINITLNYREDIEQTLKKEFPKSVDFRILSKSLDARNAPSGKIPKYHYKVELLESGEKFQMHNEQFVSLENKKNPKDRALNRPIIVGTGPAGLFCALRLLEYGIPSILIERGQRAKPRMISIAKYWRQGILDTNSNVCFGEGGAGLFSDGKLITRIKSPYVLYVMKKLVEFGAPKEIVYYSNPHLGSNKIRSLIGRVSDYLENNGCQLHFNTLVDDLIIEDHQIKGVQIININTNTNTSTNDALKNLETKKIEKIYSSNVVLATGHSAEDIYQLLQKKEVALEAKSFSMGVRVEHRRKEFDRLQYGTFANDHKLGASKYRLSYHNKQTNIGTYSFCMCPGGHVLSSGTDSFGLVTNGMSNFRRNSPWSNAAIVVEVQKGLHFEDNVKSALAFQKKVERAAFHFSKENASGREIPSQRMKDFCDGKKSMSLPKSSCPSGLVSSNLEALFPNFIIKHLQSSFLNFNNKIKGFLSNDAILLAPETRTSAPLRIVRNRDDLQSVNIEGLYPCGEGAGYAGGITSAAVDGVKCAMEILKKENDFLS